MVDLVASKRDWLDEGIRVLGEQGAPGLTIDELCGRMELSKGSFYHHFKGISGYKVALLEYFEAEHTTRFIDLAEREPEPKDRLRRLLDVILADDKSGPDLEIGVRAWAQQDEQAREVLARVDARRVDYVGSLWLAMGYPKTQARRLGQLLYLLIIGAGHIIPAVGPKELRELCELATTGM